MTRAMQSAAKRGVDVRVLLPGEPDQRFVELASLTYYTEMIDCGVRLFRYKGRFMHHKVVLVDQELAAVGTVNLDYRSLYLNFEETAVVADRQFAGRVEAMLEDDLSHCDEVSSGYLENEPLHIRVQARVARLASPLL
jgi:cardiolipin synthase